MKQDSRIKETLVDLIKVNTQRLQGYAIALESITFSSDELKNMFEQKIENIYQHIQDLRFQLRMMGGPSLEKPSMCSKIYTVWCDLKKSFEYDLSNFDVKKCLSTEEVVDNAYQTVLEDEEVDDYTIRQMLFDHRENIKRDLSTMQSQFA
jgi:uncharacterized protein (TIGR02284 family)